MEGNFRKVEYLKCKICGYKMRVPFHCSIPMLYVDEDYIPVSKPTKSELEEMRKIYGG